MITEYYWQNTDIRKKILIITWQFVFFPPHPYQPWHPWTISIYSVFPQSHGVLDLWSFWLPSLRINWSKCSLSATCQMGQTIPAEEREAWGIYTPHLQGSHWTAQAVFVIWCLLLNGTALLAEVQLRMCWSSLDSCLQNSPTQFCCCSHRSYLYCPCSYQDVSTFIVFISLIYKHSFEYWSYPPKCLQPFNPAVNLQI